MECMANDFRLIGKIGKVLSIIGLVYGLINVILGVLYELFFKGIFDNPNGENRSGLIAVLLILLLVLLVFFMLKIMGIFVVVISGITLFLSILCLNYSKKNIEELKKDKIILYLISAGYLILSLVFLILTFIFFDLILVGIILFVLTAIYGFVGIKILLHITHLGDYNEEVIEEV